MQNFASPPLSAPFLLFLTNDQQRRQEPLHPQTVFAMARKEEQTLPPQEDQTILEHHDDDDQEVELMNEEEQEWDESSLYNNNSSSSSAQGGIRLGTSSFHAHFIMQQAQRGMLHPLADEDFREMELRLQAMRDIGLRFHGRLEAGVSSPAEEADNYEEEEDAPRRNE
ncbi:hypothetical protein QOT17_016701 [Balamuthia mandrillaris]